MSNNGVKVVVFGIGGYWNLIKDHLTEEINITAYMDNNKSVWGGETSGAVAGIGF